MKQGMQSSMKLKNTNADQMQVFLITNNDGIMINVGANVNNYLTK